MNTKSIKNIKQGLSRREALALARLASQNQTIITIDDIQTAIDVPYDNAKKIANNLVHKRWLDRLKSGTYLIVPLAAGETAEYTEHEFVIAAHLVDPMYIAYWTALNYHGLTEQVPLTVFAATTAQVPAREIHDVTYTFVTVTEEKFFGYDPVAIDAQQVNVASVEKTLVDCADHPEYCGGIGELAKGLAAADFEQATLTEYLRRQGNGAAIKRIVYLADRLEIELEQRDELVAGFTAGYSKLDPTRGDEGRHVSEYRLLVNVPADEITTMVGDRS
ncbi:type IV toxin-antitoxin system AbiEi family antitoxin domain-containing protein [Halalkalirubrum salinum]|uniref:type IV toxin-antitoxin system AbiEi family antitoxin domain-containing protein n=1 Tax=Halalkalirubrum salinum TaxID=2563889 RepID=UPI0010FB4219|nr:type IV toxin-antitoxin system AbiEi family antitoxin [Halalkalirubrum salinum]